jgi:hypothetical protein
VRARDSSSMSLSNLIRRLRPSPERLAAAAAPHDSSLLLRLGTER